MNSAEETSTLALVAHVADKIICSDIKKLLAQLGADAPKTIFELLLLGVPNAASGAFNMPYPTIYPAVPVSRIS